MELKSFATELPRECRKVYKKDNRLFKKKKLKEFELTFREESSALSTLELLMELHGIGKEWNSNT